MVTHGATGGWQGSGREREGD
ncbi:hypothetical protein BN2475_170066 [Paraburkholderia ribeironis]|uniref:Uncharacterized protein n=1 Tax=Paraburkholderia ribeironis TaxID=1247936 RepID=A0A1N7RUM9_9BURK|nr:hypothetical protein BN2475_170066 [Paraburkholderia ribeironis]